MKRLIYITYLGLLALILISCEKEVIAPDVITEESSLAAERSAGTSCTNYSYQTKTGTEQLGNARTDVMLVVFKPGVTPAQQLNTLSQFNIFRSISSSMLNDSGEEIQIVELKKNATCDNVEMMLILLEANQKVKYARPAFNGPPNSGILWLGLTSEFIVTLANPNHAAKLQKLANLTNTVIIDDWGNGTYLMGTTRNSGNALQMSTIFNQHPAISIAEPNFIFQFAPFKYKKLSDIKKAEILAAN